MSQGYLIGSVRICSKYDEHKPKKYRSWFEVALTDENWDKLSINIIIIMDCNLLNKVRIDESILT